MQNLTYKILEKHLLKGKLEADQSDRNYSGERIT